jgi:ATP-binding protein involved in chromosome partitioning
MVTELDVLDSMRHIIDPDLGKDIVSLGFVKNIQIDGGKVSFAIELTTPACPVKEHFRKQAEDAVREITGVTDVQITMTAQVRSHTPASATGFNGAIKNVIAVASGKGGVGKSTVSVNLACALAEMGAKVGLLDADIYGPSVPTLLGITQPQLSVTEDKKVLPLETYNIKVMSMGFLLDDNSPVIWRGPMVHGILQQFLGQVIWGDLDYLVIDLPPGTGDAQLTICQSANLSGAVIVTTPQAMSISIAQKGLKMFGEVNVPILGMVENMSHFSCPHCQERSEIFRHGGTERVCDQLGVPFLGEIPIEPQITLQGDAGIPIVVADPTSKSATAFFQLAGNVAAKLSTQAMGKPQAAGNVSLDWK